MSGCLMIFTSVAFVLGVRTCDSTGRPVESDIISDAFHIHKVLSLSFFWENCFEFIITLFSSIILTVFNNFFILDTIACTLRKYHQPHLETENSSLLKLSTQYFHGGPVT